MPMHPTVYRYSAPPLAPSAFWRGLDLHDSRTIADAYRALANRSAHTDSTRLPQAKLRDQQRAQAHAAKQEVRRG